MLSMDVAPRGSVRGIKLSVGETRIGPPWKEGQGLTQVEFDAASMAGAAGIGKVVVPRGRYPGIRRKYVSRSGSDTTASRREPKKTAESGPAVVPGKKTLRLRCRAPTDRSSAASRTAGCFRSRPTFRISAA